MKMLVIGREPAGGATPPGGAGAAGAAALGVGKGLKLISEKFLGLGTSVKWRTLISKVRTTVFGERLRAKVQQDSSWEDVRTGCKRPLICLEEIGKELRIGAISVVSTVAIANGSMIRIISLRRSWTASVLNVVRALPSENKISRSGRVVE